MELHSYPVFVAFGGNLGDPRETALHAIELMSARLGAVQARSSFYETTALTLHGEEQPNYVNGVVQFESATKPDKILALLLDVEKQLGRERSESMRWTPRVIDLDLIFVGHLTMHSSTLTLPHMECHKRDFVLEPMAEIAPEFIHPVLNESIAALLHSLESRGFHRFIISRDGCKGAGSTPSQEV